jgi:hypothetical protein
VLENVAHENTRDTAAVLDEIDHLGAIGRGSPVGQTRTTTLPSKRM